MSNRTGRTGAGKNIEIGEGTDELRRRNEKLRRMSAKVGTKADTPDFRDKLEKEVKDANKLAKRVMTSLQENKDADPEMVRKLTKEFAEEFRAFQAINEQLRHRENSLMRTFSAREGGSSFKPESDLKPGRDSSAPQYTQQEQLMIQDMNIEFLEWNADEIEHRHQRIQAIERDVLEVNEMFRDLAHLVNEQGEHIITIETNVSNTKQHTEAAHAELLKAEEYQMRARRKQCCILFILLAVAAAIAVGIWAAAK